MRRNSIETEWIFDVEEFDEESISISLLQELEIDIQLIFQTIKWMLSYPWFWFFISSSSSSVHPLASHVSQREFWGPCFVVSLYGMTLWFSKLPNVLWVFAIWGIATIFQQMIGRVFLTQSSFSLHSVILGYSAASLIPVSLLVTILHPTNFVSDLLKITGILWATTSAFISYLQVTAVVTEVKESRRYLLMMPILLMHVYLISLLPRL